MIITIETANTISDLSKLTVVQHNDLIESSYFLKLDEIRLINLVLTKIDSRKSNPGAIEIYPNEFYQMYNLQKKNICRNMKKSVDSIMNKHIFVDFRDEKNRLQKKKISWFNSTQYVNKDDEGRKIELFFTDEIAQYLFELKGNFTKVNFDNLKGLTTPFSLRLYQWLVREYRVTNSGYYGSSFGVHF